MTFFQTLLEQPIMTRLGWVLLHSIWQVAAVALLLALVLVFCRKRGARANYAACCVALLLSAALPAITFFLVPEQPPMRTAHAEAEAGLAVDAANDDAAALPDAPDGAVMPFRKPLPNLAVGSPALPNSSEGVAVPPTPTIPVVEVVASFGRRVISSASSWLPWVVVGWLLGVAALSVWNLGGWMAVQRLKVKGTSRVSVAIQQAAERMARQLGLNRPLRLLSSALVDSPLVIGAFKPLILLPASLLCQLPPDQLESLLAHELAHILRQDYLINLLQCAIETLLFYHPAVWWISAQTRVQREYCCDDIAVNLASDRSVYVRALAAVAGAKTKALAPAASGWRLLPRLQRLLGTANPQSQYPSRWFTGVAALTLIATTIGLMSVRSHSATAQTPPNVETAQAPQTSPTPEELAIQAVLKVGGQIRRDATAKGNPVIGVYLGRGQVAMSGGPGVTDATLKDLGEFKNLKSLLLNGAAVTDTGMAYLKEIKSLQSLILSNTQITSAGLKEIKELKNLQELNLQMTAVTDAGLDYLKDLPSLHTLFLSDTHVTDAGLKKLQDIPSLNDLSLGGAQVTDASLKEIAKLKGLQKLVLVQPKSLNIGLKYLEEVKSLQSLYLAGPQITDAALKNLKGLENLTTVVISNADVSDKGLKDLTELTNLQTLRLSETLVTNEGLEELRALKNLQSLDLSRSAVTDEGLPHLMVLLHLRTLNLNATNVTAAGLDLLKKALPQCQITGREVASAMPGPIRSPVPSAKQALVVHAIERLGGKIAGARSMGRWTVMGVDLSGYQVTDAALQDLKELNGPLTRLTLAETSVTDGGLKHLEGLTSLQSLSLRHTKITDAGLKYLEGLKNLEGLNLGYTKATKAGVMKLQQALPECRIVGPGPTEVFEEGMEAGGLRAGRPARGARGQIRTTFGRGARAEAAPIIAANEQELAALQAIQKLGGQFSRDPKGEDHPIVDVGIYQGSGATDEVFQHLKLFKSLKTLYLNAPEISDKGLRELKDHQSLVGLQLINTRMTDAGLHELKELRNLHDLVFEGSQVTDAGLKELKDHSNLESLTLGGPHITDAGLKKLKDLKNLQTLTFRYTKVTDQGMKELHDLKNLKTLRLGGTMVNGSGLGELKELKNLQTLDLSHAEMKDEGLLGLKELTNLQTLNLDYTQVTDAGLKELKGLKNLQALNLANTQVTGTGLMELTALTNLKTLDLGHTELRPGSLATLKNLKNLETLDVNTTLLHDSRLRAFGNNNFMSPQIASR